MRITRLFGLFFRQGLLDSVQEFIFAEWLGQKYRVQRQIRRPFARAKRTAYQDAPAVRVFSGYILENTLSAAFWQDVIRDEQVNGLSALRHDVVEGLFGGLGGENREAGIREPLTDKFKQVWLIFDN